MPDRAVVCGLVNGFVGRARRGKVGQGARLKHNIDEALGYFRGCGKCRIVTSFRGRQPHKSKHRLGAGAKFHNEKRVRR
jgi:hypothetical protein